MKGIARVSILANALAACLLAACVLAAPAAAAPAVGDGAAAATTRVVRGDCVRGGQFDLVTLDRVADRSLASGPLGALAAGPKRIPLVVVVAGFSDMPYSRDYDWHQVIFEDEEGLSAFYLDNSAGQFTFEPACETCAAGGANANVADAENDGIVHVTLPRAHGDWGVLPEGSPEEADLAQALLQAVAAASGYVDFASFDADGDGAIETNELALAFVIAGYDGSSGGSHETGPYLWPFAWAFDEALPEGVEAPSFGGVTVSNFICMAECLEPGVRADTGTLCHELGHYLGLPDLYDTDEQAYSQDEYVPWAEYQVSQLSVMASGTWAYVRGEDGTQRLLPTNMDAWCRYMLGWIDPVLATEGTFSVASREAGDTVLLVPTEAPAEYYLVENRQFTGFDRGLAYLYGNAQPAGGIVLWHVDKDVLWAFGGSNQVNNAWHLPAVMPLFAEYDLLGQATLDPELAWTAACYEPFFDAGLWGSRYEAGPAAVPLPLHGACDWESAPAERLAGSVSVELLDASAPVMNVRVQPGGALGGFSNKVLPLDAEAAEQLRVADDALGHAVATALVFDGASDAALVDAGSIAAGVPAGDLPFDLASQVLPGSARVSELELTGAQLHDTLEQSVALSLQCRNALASGAGSGAGGAGGGAGSGAGGAGDGWVVFDAQIIDPFSLGDAVLSTSALSYVVDWSQPAGYRVQGLSLIADVYDDAGDAQAATLLIADDDVLSVAVPSTLLDGYYTHLTSENVRSQSLGGYAADALRSFLQQDGWEDAFEANRGVVVYRDPDAEPTSPVQAAALFADVAPTDWVARDGYLGFALDHGLMGGSGDRFNPARPITRAQVAVILYRMVNPLAAYVETPSVLLRNETPFVDNTSGQYYTQAVNWAYGAGVLQGNERGGRLYVRPGDPVTRQQLATMFYRFAVEVRGQSAAGDDSFAGISAPDAGAVAGYARPGVAWCYANGLLTGGTGGALSPASNTTRAAACKMVSVLAGFSGDGTMSPAR